MSENYNNSSAEHDELKRSLSNRHLQLIAIGGAIGTGLFMGSGKTISLAGPSILVIYMIIGFMVFLVMRALGELLLSNLQYKSFIDFATDLIGPWAGYFVGWTYWLCWITIGIADLSAIIYYLQFFNNGLPFSPEEGVMIRFTSDAGTVASFSHIWDHGGIFPTGAMGFLAGFQIAIFAFVGVEL
ncbi:unnamed protein product, partial [Cylicostephanus goldi]